MPDDNALEVRQRSLVERVKGMAAQANGKHAARYVLYALGSVPGFGGMIAGAGATWAELEQAEFNGLVEKWHIDTEERLRAVETVLSAWEELRCPSPNELVNLLRKVFGADGVRQLASVASGREDDGATVTIILNAATAAELHQWSLLERVRMQSTGSMMSMGAGNSVGGHMEEQFRKFGMGSGFQLSLPGDVVRALVNNTPLA